MAVHLLEPWDLVASALNDNNDDDGHHCRHHQQSASFSSLLSKQLMHTVPWDLEVSALNDYDDDDDGYHNERNFQCNHNHHHQFSPSKQLMHLLALWDLVVSALEGDFEKRTKEMVLQNLL